MSAPEPKRPWWPSHFQLDNARWHERATRRFVLKTGGAIAATAAVGSVGLNALAQESGSSTTAVATPSTSTATASGTAVADASSICVLTPELTEGPYYLDDLLVRSDITEGKAGIPMALKITVVDSSTCVPIENAAVDVWHCDVNGYYSGYTSASPDPADTTGYQDDGSDPDTFLRGVLLTGSDGLAEFQTIYPGWYISRDIHIHMKVHIGGAVEDGTYDGGTTAHTGQLAFSDEFTDRVALIEPYASRVSTFTRLDEDTVFGGVEEDDPTYFLTLTPDDDSDLSKGITAEIIVGVDPTATSNDGSGMGGGPTGDQQGGGPGGQGGQGGGMPGGQGGPGNGQMPPFDQDTDDEDDDSSATPAATATPSV